MTLGFLLTACGGGGGSSDPTPTSHAAPKAVVIDAEGDSTMYGLVLMPDGTYTQTPNNAPADLQVSLQTQFGPTVTVVDGGIPGSTLPQRLNGSAPSYTQPLTAMLSSSSAQFVMGNWGINDANQGGNETAAQFQAYLVEFVTEVRAAGKTPILEEPNPSLAFPVADYVAAIDYVAAQMNVPLVQQYAYIMSLPNWQSLLPDGVHPNVALYQIKADREAAVIAPLVGALIANK